MSIFVNDNQDVLSERLQKPYTFHFAQDNAVSGSDEFTLSGTITTQECLFFSIEQIYFYHRFYTSPPYSLLNTEFWYVLFFTPQSETLHNRYFMNAPAVTPSKNLMLAGNHASMNFLYLNDYVLNNISFDINYSIRVKYPATRTGTAEINFIIIGHYWN